MMQFQTLVAALEHNRSDDRFVVFINGQDQEKVITFNELYQRALGLLNFLQGKDVNQGDYLILNLNDNEQMVDVFWACQLGGIIPVPLAIGISDQHRKKVFNVYQQLTSKKLKKAYVYTDRKTLHKLQASATDQSDNMIWQSLSENAILTDDVVDVSCCLSLLFDACCCFFVRFLLFVVVRRILLLLAVACCYLLLPVVACDCLSLFRVLSCRSLLVVVVH